MLYTVEFSFISCHPKYNVLFFQVEGIHVESPRKNAVLPDKLFSHPEACPLCRLNLQVKYTVSFWFLTLQ